MPRPVHFDLTADDPGRAAAFYSSVFGWTITKWDGPMDYWLITTGEEGEPGIDGGLAARGEGDPPLMHTIGVPSLDEYTDRVSGAGGAVLRPKSPIPGVGWFALCADSEGNQLGLLEADPNAGM
jgi:predicted enzyme related to lactoylglutathione lyase